MVKPALPNWAYTWRKYSPSGPTEESISASYSSADLLNSVVSDFTLLICELGPVHKTIAYFVTSDKEVSESELSSSSVHLTVTVVEPPEASKDCPDVGAYMDTSALA